MPKRTPLDWDDLERELHAAGVSPSEIEAGARQLLARARGYQLAQTRKQLGLGQKQIAAAMGVSVSRVSQIEQRRGHLLRGHRPLRRGPWRPAGSRGRFRRRDPSGCPSPTPLPPHTRRQPLHGRSAQWLIAQAYLRAARPPRRRATVAVITEREERASIAIGTNLPFSKAPCSPTPRLLAVQQQPQRKASPASSDLVSVRMKRAAWSAAA